MQNARSAVGRIPGRMQNASELTVWLANDSFLQSRSDPFILRLDGEEAADWRARIALDAVSI
jgi:hypothetical protein